VARDMPLSPLGTMASANRKKWRASGKEAHGRAIATHVATVEGDGEATNNTKTLAIWALRHM
jgi:hypothetical protein